MHYKCAFCIPVDVFKTSAHASWAKATPPLSILCLRPRRHNHLTLEVTTFQERLKTHSYVEKIDWYTLTAQALILKIETLA